MSNNKKLKLISLFSGAMGLDLGLEKAGFETIYCVENNEKAVKTIKHNRPDLQVFNGSITELNGNDIRKSCGLSKDEAIPLLAGGPPCQAFSVFGNRLGIEDARGQLVFEFIRLVKELRPEYFLMENVRGLLSMSIIPKSLKDKYKTADVEKDYFKNGSLLQKIFDEFKKIGYNADCFVVNSVNYGAPQIRERMLIIGNKNGKKLEFPKPSHSNRPEDLLPPFKTLGEVIGPNSDFQDDREPEVLNFSPRKLRYLSMVPPGGNWRSLPVEVQKESMGKSWYLKGGRSAYWRKLSFSFPSPTVVTMPNHAGTSMCHPFELRAISVKEAAAIQEFPKDWQFIGSTGDKFKQIGNAVPIRLGEVAGNAIIASMKKNFEEMVDSALFAKNLDNTIVHIRPHVRTRTFWKNGKAFSGDNSYYSEAEANQFELFSD
jgi:DNA (cytosine-5)-methyltransferase 1